MSDSSSEGSGYNSALETTLADKDEPPVFALFDPPSDSAAAADTTMSVTKTEFDDAVKDLKAQIKSLQDANDTLTGQLGQGGGGGAPDDLKHIKPLTFELTSGESWMNFKAHFRLTAEAKRNIWTPKTAKINLALAMRKAAAECVHDIDPLDDTKYPDFEALLKAYDERFLPSANTELLKLQADQAKQGINESLLAWSTRYSQLFRRAYPDTWKEKEEDMTRHFIYHLRNQKVVKDVIRREPTNYQEALLFAQKESALVDVTEGTRMTNWTRFNKPTEGINATINHEDQAIAIVDRKTARCHYCNNVGHFKKECRKFSEAVKAKMKARMTNQRSRRNSTRHQVRDRSAYSQKIQKVMAAITADSDDEPNEPETEPNEEKTREEEEETVEDEDAVEEQMDEVLCSLTHDEMEELAGALDHETAV